MDEYKIIEKAIDHGAEYCDIRIEETMETNISRRNRELYRAVLGAEKGFGIRVLYKGVWGFSSSNNISYANLKNALDKAINIAKATSTRSKEKTELADAKIVKDKVIWKPKINPLDIDIEEKNKMLVAIEKEMYKHDEIKSVDQSYVDEKTKLHFVNSESIDISYELTRVFLQVNLIARREGNMNSMRFRIGGTCGYEIFNETTSTCPPLVPLAKIPNFISSISSSKECSPGKIIVLLIRTNGLYANDCALAPPLE